MMRQTAIDFVNTRVIPNLDAIDNMQEGLMPSLLEEAGELGLVGAGRSRRPWRNGARL